MPAVRDIDASTATDPLYFTDYVNDMFEHYRQQEVREQHREVACNQLFHLGSGHWCMVYTHSCTRSRWQSC